jgi:hypothetical protein
MTQSLSQLYQFIISGFKSRSFQSFQEALERGETTHMMPVENAKEKLARKEIKLEDIPYMQRGGSWVRSNFIAIIFVTYHIGLKDRIFT